MPNCASALRLTATAAVVWLAVCPGAEARQTARARYEFAIEREAAVRKLLANDADRMPASQLSAEVSRVLTAFESVVRRYPSSGYADNALFQAGALADTAFETLRQPTYRERAVRFADVRQENRVVEVVDDGQAATRDEPFDERRAERDGFPIEKNQVVVAEREQLAQAS